MDSNDDVVLRALLALIIAVLLLLQQLPAALAAPNEPILPPAIKTYAVHENCYKKEPRFDKVIEQMFLNAKNAVRRTNLAHAGLDKDWESVFALVVNAKVDGTTLFESTKPYKDTWKDKEPLVARKHVERNLGAMSTGQWVKVDSGAEVQINCDNMEHWEEKPATPESGNKISYFDPVNYVESYISCASTVPGTGDAVVNANVAIYHGHITPPQHKAKDLHPYRSVVTLCDYAFGKKWRKQTLQDYDYNPSEEDPKRRYTDLSRLKWGVDALRTLEHLLLHEWLHTWRFRLLDHPPDSDPTATAGWEVVFGMKGPQEAVTDCEVMAYLGTFAWLAEHPPNDPSTGRPMNKGGYTMNRDITQVTYEKLRDGKFIKGYSDISTG